MTTLKLSLILQEEYCSISIVVSPFLKVVLTKRLVIITHKFVKIVIFQHKDIFAKSSTTPSPETNLDNKSGGLISDGNYLHYNRHFKLILINCECDLSR